MRMSTENAKKVAALEAIGYTHEAAIAVVYPKVAAKAKPTPEPTPEQILVDSGFTADEAAALVGGTPVVEPTADELRAAAVAEGGFTFGKGRIYLHDALIEAAIGMEVGAFKIVPNLAGAGAVLVFFDVEKGLAMQTLFAKK